MHGLVICVLGNGFMMGPNPYPLVEWKSRPKSKEELIDLLKLLLQDASRVLLLYIAHRLGRLARRSVYSHFILQYN
jgi:hypothetical protein